MKVLIVRVGAMGDVLHALPAAAALRRALPGCAIDWVVDERWAALLAGDDRGPIVDRIFPVSIRAWKQHPFSRATRAALLAFRKLRASYDFVVDMQGTMRSAVIGWLAGSRSLAGYDDPREPLAARLYAKRLPREGAHVVEQGAALLGRAVGRQLQPVDIALPTTAWAEDWAAHEVARSRPLALLAPGAGWGAKQWPAENFAALARVLRGRGYDVVVNAHRKDEELPRAVAEASGGNARSLVCNVAGLVAVMRRAELVVGGDSGPVHLAAALAVPLVALFGPTNPARNGPWGPGAKVVLRDAASITNYKRNAEVDAGLARISVEQVMAAVDSLSGK